MSTELVELRTFYSSPGFLMLARVDGEPAGCVGVRALTDSRGELRRLFVHPDHRGRGLGRRLLHNATEEAGRNGVNRLVLNTLPTMTQARLLYEEDGYVPIPAYVAEPLEGVQYLGRVL